MSEYGSTQSSARGGMRLKHIALLLFVAFAAGGVATWWLSDEYGLLGTSGPAEVSNVVSTNPTPSTANVAPATVALDTPAEVSATVPPLLVAATAASADVSRGEGLLLTHVVRKTIDDGAPLGYLAEQLRLRFGASQPRAVATVISAAQAPVTRETLVSELRALEPALMMNKTDEDLWTKVKREFSGLFVLRMDGAVSIAPDVRFARAQAFAEAGDMKAARAEVVSLPGANSARSWLARAKRYDDARAALQQLEDVALVRPLTIPVAVTPPPITEQPEEAPAAPTP